MKKTLTLISFICLIATLVLYKAGAFDKHISSTAKKYYLSPNGGTANQVMLKNDTIPENNQDSVKATKEKTIMWSSKAAAPIKPSEITIKTPTYTPHTKKNMTANDSAIYRLKKAPQDKKEQIIWSGSKSGRIFTQDDTIIKKLLIKLKEDSLKLKH